MCMYVCVISLDSPSLSFLSHFFFLFYTLFLLVLLYIIYLSLTHTHTHTYTHSNKHTHTLSLPSSLPRSLALQLKLGELNLQQANLQELIVSLQSPADSTPKLLEWHAKLGEARLREMKAVRRAGEREGRVRRVEEEAEERERELERLERELVEVTKVTSAWCVEI